jgi:hypothetical protein
MGRLRTPVAAAICAVALVGANLAARRVLAPLSEAPRSSLAPTSTTSKRAMPAPNSRARTRGSADAEPEDEAHALLAEMGRRPFSETESYFREVLASPELPTEFKVAWVEALAWFDGSEGIPGALLDLLETERSANVRAELYRALAFDAGETYAHARLGDLVGMLFSEQRSGARVQGFRLAASVLRLHPDPHLAEIFDREMVPWLREEGLRNGSRYSRLVSVDALKLANTSAAAEALHDLSRSQDPSVARAADHALLARERLRDSI